MVCFNSCTCFCFGNRISIISRIVVDTGVWLILQKPAIGLRPTGLHRSAVPTTRVFGDLGSYHISDDEMMRIKTPQKTHRLIIRELKNCTTILTQYLHRIFILETRAIWLINVAQ